MRFKEVFLVFVVFETLSSKQIPSYSKFTRCGISSSQKTCVSKAFCDVKLKSRYVSSMNFGCDLNRPLTKFYIDMTVSYKNIGNNYRQIIDLKKIDVCELTGNAHQLPFSEKPIIWFNLTYPNLLHKCPYTDFKCFNASLNMEKEAKVIGDWLKFFPNGVFKIKTRAFDDLDDNIVEIISYMVVQERNKFSDL